jgi:hypothetical protein
MKHTLKSLLITSVLTVPSIFASGDALSKQDEERIVGAQTAVTEDVVITSRPKETEAMLLSYCDLADATAFGIIYAAWIMKLLGPEFKGTAVALFELAANHPSATHYEIKHIARNMSDMGFYKRAKALQERAVVKKLEEREALQKFVAEKKLREAAQKNEN